MRNDEISNLEDAWEHTSTKLTEVLAELAHDDLLLKGARENLMVALTSETPSSPEQAEVLVEKLWTTLARLCNTAAYRDRLEEDLDRIEAEMENADHAFEAACPWCPDTHEPGETCPLECPCSEPGEECTPACVAIAEEEGLPRIRARIGEPVPAGWAKVGGPSDEETTNRLLTLLGV